MASILDSLLLVFDTETTGINTSEDRIVEVGAAYMRRGELVGPGRCMRLNPGVPIPEGASAVHGIYDSDVAKCPSFRDIADRLAQHFRGSENGGHPPLLCGYNAVRFDAPLLNAEWQRAEFEFEIDALQVLDPIIFLQWHHRAWGRHTLGLMAERFGVELRNAHAASADAKATGKLLSTLVERGLIPDDSQQALAQQEKFRRGLEAEHEELGRLLYRDRKTDALHIGFGKHCGTPLDESDTSYLRWCLEKLDNIPETVEQLFRERVEKSG